jgi:hypothetical protein
MSSTPNWKYTKTHKPNHYVRVEVIDKAYGRKLNIPYVFNGTNWFTEDGELKNPPWKWKYTY